MKFSKKDINKLKCKIQDCISKIGYQISIKDPIGYDTEELKQKLLYVQSLESIVDGYPCSCSKKIKNGIIEFCGKKVLLSKNNPIILDSIGSKDDCKNIEFSEEYCVDLCEVESKLSSICINC